MIYVIESGEHFKVGFSTNWDRRKQSYETHIPVFKVVQLFDGDRDLEKYIHLRLGKYKLGRKEWFNTYKNYLVDIYLIIQEYENDNAPDLISNEYTITKDVVKYFNIINRYDWIKDEYPVLFKKGKVYIAEGFKGKIILLNPNLQSRTRTKETMRLFQTFQ